MMFMRLLPWAAAGLLVLSSACGRRPKGVLSDDEMADVMTDMKLAESYANTYGGSPSDSIPQRLAQSVLDAHGVSRADFDSTLSWYGRNFDDYVALYDKMEKRLAQKQKDYVPESSAGKEDGNDLWPYMHRVLVSPKGNSDGFTFSISVPDIVPGEALKWMMRLNSDAEGKMLIGVDYADGKSDYVVQQIAGNRKTEMTIVTDTALAVKRIFGNFRVRPRGNPLWIDSISLTHIKLSDDDRQRSGYSMRYVLPEKYDPAKARKKAEADSLARNAVKDTLVDSQQMPGKAVEMMRPGARVAGNPVKIRR